MATLLRKRQADQQAAKRKAPGRGAPPSWPRTSRSPTLRKELNGLVGAWNHRTGQPHGVIHAELRRACGGPPIAQATAEQIRERIATIRRWATQRR